ncbi:C-terminal binding protein [Halococcus agarilyticus]|uniref:C-terminal binding protein n=1 Tax=Halococcus agarilyticus TaxID=1232219 RepID=UPI000677F817|nr:C-terminal binding protein [Halococcus agarilyticus]
MSEHTVVVTDHDFADLSIERAGLDDLADVVELPGGVGEARDTHDRLATADAVVTLRYELDETAVAAMEDCRVIARYGIGVDSVAVEAAADRGIPVTNVPDYCREEVATHTLALILALARRLATYDADVAAGGWSRGVGTPIHRFSNSTVGVVGYGAIGRAVGERAAALGADVLASDPFLSETDLADDPAELVPFEELLARSAFVTVHSPLTDGTRKLFDADAFARMRESASLVNVARGPIVDTAALRAALDDGEIAGAGLDVFPDEPPAADDPLRDHQRVITTPHVAWYSAEANEERRRTVTEIVRSVLVGDGPWNVVNGVE